MPDDDSMLAQGTVDFRNEGRRHASHGDGQLFTVPAKLTPNQQHIYEQFWAFETLDAGAAGFLLHLRRGCKWCSATEPCQYATSQGRQVLEALRKKGLLKRDRHHVYRRADQTPEPSPVLSPEDEFGF